MASFKTFALAAAAMAVFASSNVRAADLPPLLPPPPIEDYGGWYLRGDIGMTNQRFKGLQHPTFNDPAVFEWLDQGGFDSGPLFGIGIGYEYNNWLRFDVTGEYRGKVSFSALDRYDTDGDGALPLFDTDWGTNDYRGKKSEWLFLFNTFIDLGTWQGITPFVGAGIGASRVTISNFSDTNVIEGAGGYAGSGSKWNLAWALHAGLAYDVTPNFTIELAYRYVSLGDGKTGFFRNTNPGVGCQVTPPCYPMEFKGITSHDIKFGVRWMLADMGVSDWRPPVISKY